jgi:hypothetical protein
MSSLANLLKSTAPELDDELESRQSQLPPALPSEAPRKGLLAPPIPESIAQTGVGESVVEQLILKYLYYRGDMLGREIASQLGLRFSLIDPLLETMKRQHQVAVRKSLGMGNNSAIFALTDAGRNLTREYLETNQYAGPVPVPLAQYTEVVRRQKLPANWLNPDLLRGAYGHMVVEEDILAQLGPAVNASKSFLIYGQPGNGKSALAEALFHIQNEPIFIPYAIECQGNIVQVYDPIHHHKVNGPADGLSGSSEQTEFDQRWFRCKRPFIVTGGELTMEMLDLSYNKVSKVYDAPFQVKANNGTYLVDDFGRQKATPTEILNRWIVPMERSMDYLNFQSGGKMSTPFEAFIIFSTNLRPDQLGDEAFMRRIQYKMFLRSPRQPEFLKIFHRYASSHGVACQEDMAADFVQRHYVEGGKKYRRCHPRDVLTHVLDIINFEGRPMELTSDLLDRGFQSCFVETFDVTE